jgi:hypothetical protein
MNFPNGRGKVAFKVLQSCDPSAGRRSSKVEMPLTIEHVRRPSAERAPSDRHKAPRRSPCPRCGRTFTAASSYQNKPRREMAAGRRKTHVHGAAAAHVSLVIWCDCCPCFFRSVIVVLREALRRPRARRGRGRASAEAITSSQSCQAERAASRWLRLLSRREGWPMPTITRREWSAPPPPLREQIRGRREEEEEAN